MQCDVNLSPSGTVTIDMNLAAPLPSGHGAQVYFARNDGVIAGPFNVGGP